MPKTLHYNETAHVPKPAADTIRETAEAWHDPSTGNELVELRIRPDIVDGEQVTVDGTPRYEVRLRAQVTDVAETENWQAVAQTVADAINAGLPDAWPAVSPGDIDVR